MPVQHLNYGPHPSRLECFVGEVVLQARYSPKVTLGKELLPCSPETLHSLKGS